MILWATRTDVEPRGRTGWRWVLVAVIVAAAILLWRGLDAGTAFRQVLDWIDGHGVWGPLVFIAVYVVACVLMVPGSALTLGAGAVFGLLWGTVYVSIGSILGATVAFLVGRYLARDRVARRIGVNPKFAALDLAVGREGWKIVALTRLSPVFPFSFLNYAFGLTRVSLRDYFWASWICMLPFTVVYVYLGALAGDLAALDQPQRERTPLEWAAYALGLAATVAVTLQISRLAKRALANGSARKPA